MIKFRSFNPLFLACLSITAIGMLDEDTLETQAGSTQFIFMYAITWFFHQFEKTKTKEIS